jgi:transposase
MCVLSHPYPSDLSDQEWEILAPLIPPAKPGGRRRKWPMQRILNAVFYVLLISAQIPKPRILAALCNRG